MKIFISISLLFFSLLSFSQSDYEKEIKAFQDTINKQYADTTESPLLKEDLAGFKGLDFFPVDEKYRVNAKFVKVFNPIPFKMRTTTERAPVYIRYAELHFELNGKAVKLHVYQSQALLEKEEYKDFLFLAFTDLTNGKTSYGGGRYIDLKIPEGNEIIIDFNKSYNPYCAYNHKYSCVVPPADNYIDLEIKAGVMKYQENH